MVGAPPRCRQDHGSIGHHQQRGPTGRRRVGDSQEPRSRGAANGRADCRMAWRVVTCRRRASRALGRRRLPERVRRQRNPPWSSHRRRRRRIRRHDLGPLVQEANAHRGGARRNRSLFRGPVRPRDRPRVPQHWNRSPATCDGPPHLAGQHPLGRSDPDRSGRNPTCQRCRVGRRSNRRRRYRWRRHPGAG